MDDYVAQFLPKSNKKPSGAGESSTKLQYIAALSATLGALAAGSALGWSSPVLYKITQKNNTDYNFKLFYRDQAWASSIIALGGAAVSLPIGLIMDALGRKITMLLLTFPFILGWLLITFAVNVRMLLAGRFITGIAGGAFCVTAPAYTSEIAQDSIRGKLGTFFQLMLTIGILFSYVVGSYTSVFVFNIICTCIPIVFAATFVFMPESPEFLVVKGRTDEAIKSLLRLRGKDYDIDPLLHNLKHKIEQKRRQRVPFLKSITKEPALKAILICYALMSFQQFSGINAVLFNAARILRFVDASIITPGMASITIGVIQVAATFASSMVVDKLGRRMLLMSSALVMCLCTAALGVIFFLHERRNPLSGRGSVWHWHIPSVLILSLFIIAFSFGFGPIPWIMAGELCRIDIKSFVASTAGTWNWLLAFTVTYAFGLNHLIGMWKIFFFFAGFNLISFFTTLFFVPETKGKSVDEIQVLLGEEPQSIEEKIALRVFSDTNMYDENLPNYPEPLSLQSLPSYSHGL